LEIGIVKD
ncbi:unnamed protein product, partial [Allacma fusca]